MEKLTQYQENALVNMTGPYTQEKPENGRTMNSLLRKGIVRWNSISGETYGGWQLTNKGEKLQEEILN